MNNPLLRCPRSWLLDALATTNEWRLGTRRSLIACTWSLVWSAAMLALLAPGASGVVLWLIAVPFSVVVLAYAVFALLCWRRRHGRADSWGLAYARLAAIIAPLGLVVLGPAGVAFWFCLYGPPTLLLASIKDENV